MTPAASAALAELTQHFDTTTLVRDPWRLAPLEIDHRERYRGRAAAALFPRSTAQVSAALEICHRHAMPVVPQGGNTSYCGAATPDTSGDQLLLCLARMNRIRELRPIDDVMVAEAGCLLAELQQAATAADRLFPLQLGSAGSCQLGGNLSTNAGGTNVLRYGMARELVLGLEVVLADGRVLETLGALRKDNTGYDIKSLFLGAEGTLGVITAASLRLFPQPRSVATAFVALGSVQQAIELLAELRSAGGEELTSFELMPRAALQLLNRHLPDRQPPLPLDAPWFLLCELATARRGADTHHTLEDLLSAASERGLLGNAVIAQNERERQALWQLRESIPEAQRRAGPSLKHDVSVPVAVLPEFVTRGTALVEQTVSEGQLIAYGHAGDGNLHFNVSLRDGADAAAFSAREQTLRRAVHDLVHEFGGSFSAEHGIGQSKVEELERYAPALELELMRRIKLALDPQGIMNPGKVLKR